MFRLHLHIGVLFLIASTLFLSPVQGQERLKIDADWMCSFGGQHRRHSVYTFDSDRQARQAVDRIVRFTGLRSNFIVKAADVDNAQAFVQSNKRYILYNPLFMKRVASQAQTDWAAIGVMAHEVGHHLHGHTIETSGSRPVLELEADRYAGFVLQRMGATLEQALAGWREFSNERETATHPGLQSRLVAVTNGWNEARDQDQGEDSDPFPEPDPDIDPTRNESWLVAMSKGLNYTQKYYFVDTISDQNIIDDWNSGFDITCVAEGDNRWNIVMSKGTGYERQSYLVHHIFPKDSVAAKWDKDYRITTVAGGHGKWVVIMSKGSDITMQTYQIDENFPAAFIKKQWDQGYRITSMASVNNEYAVIMSKNTSLTDQKYKSFEGNIPSAWIKQQYDERYSVTSAVRKGTRWTVVVSKGTSIVQQSFSFTNVFPADWIKKKWDEKFDISIIY